MIFQSKYRITAGIYGSSMHRWRKGIVKNKDWTAEIRKGLKQFFRKPAGLYNCTASRPSATAMTEVII
jgi:hypothetical protein